METLLAALEQRWYDVVLDFSAVTFLNSSNLGALLRLRKRMMSLQRHLLLCGVGSKVWGSLIVTGVDEIFHFTDDVSTALGDAADGKSLIANKVADCIRGKFPPFASGGFIYRSLLHDSPPPSQISFFQMVISFFRVSMSHWQASNAAAR